MFGIHHLHSLNTWNNVYLVSEYGVAFAGLCDYLNIYHMICTRLPLYYQFLVGPSMVYWKPLEFDIGKIILRLQWS